MINPVKLHLVCFYLYVYTIRKLTITFFLALSSTTPSKLNQPTLNRSLPLPNQKSQQLALTSSTSTPRNTSAFGGSLHTPRSQMMTTASPASSPASRALMSQSGGLNQQLRRRTPFPIVNQQEKGVFDRIVDVLIGDGPQDRFAMICKECYSHNGRLREYISF